MDKIWEAHFMEEFSICYSYRPTWYDFAEINSLKFTFQEIWSYSSFTDHLSILSFILYLY